MYTFCPGCRTIYRITVEQLGAAGGRVCCGSCSEVYAAVDHLFETLPEARNALSVYVAGRGRPLSASGEDAAAGRKLAAPVLSRPGVLPGRFAWQELANVAVVAALVLVLGLQWLYFNRNSLAHAPGWRPVLESMCAVTGCTLPFEVALERIELLNRDVRKHPDADNALLVNATFSNKADFVQPYPVFEIRFSDLSGKAVAMRRFRPEEYLADAGRISAGLAVDRPVQVVLELQDPGERAVSFQFDFL